MKRVYRQRDLIISDYEFNIRINLYFNQIDYFVTSQSEVISNTVKFNNSKELEEYLNSNWIEP